MRDSFGTYMRQALHNINEAVVNIFMFLPYFFSVEHSFKTLFEPWKNIITKKSKPGFTFEEFGKRLADNTVSRFMGFAARSAIIAAYLMVQLFFVIFLPLFYLIFFLTAPLHYMYFSGQPTPAEKKNSLYHDFVKRHLTETQNTQQVTAWFERYYQQTESRPWWSLEALMSQPPLGRDLTTGYTPTLDQYSEELTASKAHYKYLVGRKAELDVVQQALSKSENPNVILVGEKGVGRRTIVEALAKYIYEGKANPVLAFRRVLELNMEKIMSETTDFIKREETFANLLKEAADAKNIILLINNFELYISDEKEHINLSNTIEKYASLPNLQIIAITSPYMFQKYVTPNQVISQIFEKVDVQEVTPEQALDILLDEAIELERKHGIKISYQGVKQAVELSTAHITSAPLPEKAIQLLDEACVYAKNHSPEKVVNGHIMSVIIQQKTHIPTEITGTLKQKLLNLEGVLKNRVVFQEEALQKLSSALRKSFVMAGSRKKPLASFLFLGPTGVGKTETAKAITEALFDSEQNIMRFDMSVYQSKDDISKLLGSAESNEPGLLTQAIRQQRYGTLLLDELEKAHPDLLNIFLTMLDEGYFTDGYGKRVDCTHLIIIATSNAGAQFIYEAIQQNPKDTTISDRLIDYLVAQKIYSPEFLNRFDGVVVYKPLSHEAVEKIAYHLLQDIKLAVEQKHKIAMNFSNAFITKLIADGYDPRFGARNMQRIIRDEVEDRVAKIILEGNSAGKTVTF